MEVTIYSTNNCIYCTRAKDLLRSIGIEFKDIHVDRSDDRVRAELEERSGIKTFPQIFIGNSPIGGFTELKALYDNGKLPSLLGR